jgi:two-component system chemotaxis sensor kinase CheA
VHFAGTQTNWFSNGIAVREGSTRVEVILLDKLMNLAGERVLTRNQILQISNAMHDAGLVAPRHSTCWGSRNHRTL